MPTTTFPPILIWQPGGGTPIGPVSNPPVYSQADVTQLVIGQAYVDVVFGSVQTDNSWVLVECDVVNTIDLAPLNIWPGLITNRTTAGFRVWLNGMPDSNNYYLHWAVSGVNIPPVPATSYLFTGPTSGLFGVDAIFTVKLPPSTTAAGLVITPSDGGAGGTFSPPSVTLSTGSFAATFIYHAAGYGTATISVTNNHNLTDPGSIAFTSIAPIYTFVGPSGGVSGVASTNFRVLLAGDAVLAVPTTITPHDGGAGGTFAPTTVLLVAGVPVYFTYTPASTGAKTISVTNNGGLTDPASLTYTATAPAIADGDPVSSWPDSSGNGNAATNTGAARPIYKVNILGGKPVVRCAGSQTLLLTAPITAAPAWTMFIVQKPVTPDATLWALSGTGCYGLRQNFVSGPNVYQTLADRGTDAFYINNATPVYSSGWHIFTLNSDVPGPMLWVDGTLTPTSGIGSSGGTAYGQLIAGDGDTAEVIHCAAELGLSIRAKLFVVLTVLISTGQIPSTEEAEALLESGDLAGLEAYLVDNGVSAEQASEVVTPMAAGDRANIEKYLSAKYGIAVTSGGTAVDPSTIASLVGWWKADAIT